MSSNAVDAPARPPNAPPALPRWEWGLGVAAAHLRDYPGSSHASTFALPLPWFIWRSERAEIGREGGRSTIYRSRMHDIEFTLAANPPANIDDNPERAGMEELDAVLEPGLRARWRFPMAHGWRFGVQLPVRYAFAVDDRLRSEGLGLHAEPGISLDKTLMPGWNWSLSVAAGFSEAGYADYYYGVSAAEATASRPAYNASGGYAGWLANTRIGWRRGDLTTGVFIRYEHIGDAAFNDSPLVTRNDGFSTGLTVMWRLGRSEKTVTRMP